VAAAELADQRLDIGVDLARLEMRPMRIVGQAR